MEFDKVGRLQPIQSTRGFGLSGQPYTFQPPIKPKPKKRPKRRAKGGKIVFDNRRAKYFREVNMGYRAPLRRKIHRNSTDAGRNPYDHIGRDDSLIRPDTNRDIVIKIEQLNDRKLDRDLEELQDVVDREIKRDRDRIRRPNRDFLALEDRGIRRAPAIEQGEPIEDRGVIQLGFVPPEERGLRGLAQIKEEPISPQGKGLVEDVEPSDVEKTLSLSVDAEKLLETVEQISRDVLSPTPQREREGIGGYSLREGGSVPSGAFTEVDESGKEVEGSDDPADSDFTPTKPKPKKERRRVDVVEEPTAEGFLQDQLRAQQDEEAERIIEARNQKRRAKKTPKAQRENPRLEVGEVDNAEREVNRVVDDEEEKSRGSLSAGVKEQKEGFRKKLRRKLSISKTPRGEPEGAIFVAGKTPPTEALPLFFPSPFPRADIVGDKTQLGVGGLRYDNPIESDSESSAESVAGVLDVLEGGKKIPQAYRDLPTLGELGDVELPTFSPPESDLE